jgi:hypothetical protein
MNRAPRPDGQPRPSEVDAARLSIALKEYDGTRNEIENRMDMAGHVIVGYITAIGAGISIAPRAPDVLLAVAFIAAPAWLLWLDHTEQICKLAGYIGIDLQPRVDALANDRRAFGWERFLRTIDRGGTDAGGVLFPADDPPPRVDAHHTRRAAWYVLLLSSSRPCSC